MASLAKQLEERKRQLAMAHNKIKNLSDNIMGEITKQLESKIKETEMLKEMLRSSKIELSGKDKEVRRLRAKLGTGSGSGNRRRPPDNFKPRLAAGPGRALNSYSGLGLGAGPELEPGEEDPNPPLKTSPPPHNASEGR